MWTPRRLVLLGIGFAVYLACYLSYARSFFGVIDGLPALPDIYMFVDDGTEHPMPVKDRNRHPPVEEKLKKAFGPACNELHCAIKLDINAKRMVLAADKFQIVEDGSGRVMLTPISLALFAKDKGTKESAAINTIRARVAYLRFDRPVSSLADIGGRKIVEAELIDSIEIVNNRSTPEDRTDDLYINIPKGPLFYEEARHLIWTHDTIHVKDMQVKPNPNEVWGKGMEMELLTDSPHQVANAPAHKGKQETISGAKKITLLSDVVMYLYVDSGASFPTGAEPATNNHAKKAETANAPKALINIKTPGRFTYEFGKDQHPDVARFEVPDNDPKNPVRTPQDVTVERIDPRSRGEDQLVCQKLTLQIRRKQESKSNPKDKPAGAKSPEQAMEIESMHASGSEVLLSSDAENLVAHCVDLDHNAITNTTILRGKPNMWASKEGNEITARELQLTQETLAPDKNQPQAIAPATAKVEGKRYQKVIAIGPGKIDMKDKATNKVTTHAFWKDKLIKVHEGEYDLLTLSGGARFEDDADKDNKQSLDAETIKVWLDDKPVPAGNKPRAVAVKDKDGEKSGAPTPSAQTLRPHHLEAKTNVTAISKDLNIHDTNRLSVSFRDVAEKDMPVSSQGSPNGKPPTKPAPIAPGVQSPGTLPSTVVGTATGPGNLTPPTPGFTDRPPPPVEEKKEPNKPIDLKAGTIQARVLRCDSRSALEHLWCEGDVHVNQDPSKAGEDGVEISGATLEVEPQPEGNQLHVTGDLARLKMDKICIDGPEINVDQVSNKAWVNGAGSMWMKSTTTLSGEQLKEPEPLHILWQRTMVFNGSMKLADFSGDIQAEQGDGHLTCQTLQVVFDRTISLREGTRTDKKDEKPPHVQNLLCDKSVIIDEETRDKTKEHKLIKWQHLTGTTFVMENEEDEEQPINNRESRRVTTTGPGVIRMWELDDGNTPLSGPPDLNRSGTHVANQGNPTRPGPPGQPAKPGDAKPGEAKMKLTDIKFMTNMMGNTRTNKAIFRGQVRVLSMPSDTPQQNNDFEVPPQRKDMAPDAIYLTCEQLTLLNRKENGKSNQEMEALRRVRVQARDYWGTCDTLTYNEAKNQIIFIGTPAVLYRVLHTGSQAEPIKGKKIIYLRSTGDFQVESGERDSAAATLTHCLASGAA